MTRDKAKLLIVDDTATNIQILNEALEGEFETFFALNGVDALKTAQAVLPDLILLDVMMPAMDGFEVCSRLKEDPQLKDIPVIFITALGQPEEESRGLTLGAVDYVTKPINPALVLLRVRNHLELKNQRDALERRTRELEKALAEIKLLQGIIPICASCKKIRDDKGYWQQVEVFIMNHSEAEFSHGLCPACAEKLYPNQYAKMLPKENT
ncbi:MAG: histidine kinase [Geobacteraceae bacterium GWC2_53_11]|nr:MAG: histidine kinase [Geobacteraceae bacterium GWC2_53_11]